MVARVGRRESAARSRELLLEGAIALLRTEGAAAVTTGRVAGAAGLSQSSFYAHFADRDACLEAAADAIGGRVIARLARTRGRIDPADVRGSLRRVYGSILTAFLAEPELTRIFLRHRSDETSPLGRAFRRRVDEARAQVVSILEAFGLGGDARAARAWAELLVAATLGLLEAVAFERVTSRKRVIDVLTDVTGAGLRALRSLEG